MDNNLIKWSEVSRKLCDDRTRIQSDYKGKKYKSAVIITKFYENELNKALDLAREAIDLVKDVDDEEIISKNML